MGVTGVTQLSEMFRTDPLTAQAAGASRSSWKGYEVILGNGRRARTARKYGDQN